jgi:hypothetical protein
VLPGGAHGDGICADAAAFAARRFGGRNLNVTGAVREKVSTWVLMKGVNEGNLCMLAARYARRPLG